MSDDQVNPDPKTSIVLHPQPAGDPAVVEPRDKDTVRKPDTHDEQPVTAGTQLPTGTEQAEKDQAAVERTSDSALSTEKGGNLPEEASSAQLPAVTPDTQSDEQVLAESRRRTRRSFLLAGGATLAGYGFYHWLDVGPKDDTLPTLLNRTYDANAAISRKLLDQHALSPTYPLSRAETLRVNGIYGVKRALKPDSYRLQVVGVKDASHHPRFVSDVTTWNYEYEQQESHEDQGHDTKVDPAKIATAQADKKQDDEQDELHTGRKPRGEEESGESYSTLRPNTPGLLLTLDDFLPRLQRHELVTQFKCIEGWSQIVHWAGVRLADFIALYPPALIDGEEPKYVYMETPDGDYYVGYDLAVCRHPQTLLVTEMMGAPLTQSHGAPLRIHMPTKYGYKQIKRVALIAYTHDKPDDYWTELGYDWYGGL